MRHVGWTFNNTVKVAQLWLVSLTVPGTRGVAPSEQQDIAYAQQCRDERRGAGHDAKAGQDQRKDDDAETDAPGKRPVDTWPDPCLPPIILYNPLRNAILDVSDHTTKCRYRRRRKS